MGYYVLSSVAITYATVGSVAITYSVLSHVDIKVEGGVSNGIGRN